jgi:exosortase/archaeosortase family protein
VTVGVLFAYLSYRQRWKQVLFVVASVVVPILANWLRAYMIVMIGHLSDMKFAAGVDHIIYGWVFFGVVMLLLFWIGSFWRDDDVPVTSVGEGVGTARTSPASRAQMAGAAVAAVAVAGAWPLYAEYLDRSAGDGALVRLEAPAPAQGWSVDPAPLTDWRPRYEGASARSSRPIARAIARWCSTSATTRDRPRTQSSLPP